MTEKRTPAWADFNRRLRALGREDGPHGLLIKQLRARFGELDEGVIARLEVASRDELARWADRVLEAETLEDALAADASSSSAGGPRGDQT